MTEPRDGQFNAGNGDGLPRYQPTNHPEDRPDFGHGQGGNSGYNTAGYGNAGYAHSGYGEPAGVGYQGAYEGAPGAGNGTGLTRPSNGRINIGDAIGWGFKASFSNWKLWILGALALGVVMGLISMVIGFIGGAAGNADPQNPFGAPQIITQIVSGIIGFIISLIIYRLALRQIDEANAGWGDIGRDVRWGPTLAIMVIVGAVSLVIWILFALALGTWAAGTNPVTDAQVAAAVGKLLGGLGLFMLVSFLLSPLYYLMAWYAADGRAGVGGSIREGFQAGKRNYLPLLGLSLVTGLIMFFTFPVGFLTYPAVLLAMAHGYRQAAGGPVPVEGRKG